ncbi:FAD binding domain-containing protein [Rutstroemia sp. NJR-2017a BVV2]|nr:FAD binding domain-containing protein [Rutstroemia sp. NJR-2017a BVV2]PQE21862.1 FAD binding domain-containing protein [Rutstroemia sp. NJR-2017a BVV2]
MAACMELQRTLQSKVSFPNSTEYVYEESQYWSAQQSSAVPTCRIAPLSAKDVSQAILALKKNQCQFAVKSGGHSAFRGGSNIDGGVTIDLLHLNQVDVSADQKSTSLGPGNRWLDVYSKLDARNLSVVGGRVADIGVGGLTLGGGISFFSNRYGWACDNVINYEVVLADGSIRNVNKASYPDLFFALRGGGNNFGVVTRFDVNTFPQGPMLGGMQYYDWSYRSTLFKAFEEFNINSPTDPYGALILSFGYDQANDVYAAITDLEYGKPVLNPPILQNFTSIPHLVSTVTITNLSQLTIDIKGADPYGYRQSYWTLTMKNNADLMGKVMDIFQEVVDPLKNLTGILPAISFQPISTAMTSHFTGNALGVTAADGPTTNINLALRWSLASDDDVIQNAARSIISRSNNTAHAMGLGFRYLYQNYASHEQNVFWSYGEENLAKLRAVSKKYDPEGVFTKLQPGYFKI